MLSVVSLIIFEFWVVCGQYITDVLVSEIEPSRLLFLSLRAKTVRILLRMNTERCRLEEGYNSYPFVCWKTFRQKPF